MDRAEIADVVGGIIREALQEPGLKLDMHSSARNIPGWDSITTVNVILQTEKVFGINFADADIEDFFSFSSILRNVEARLAP